MERAEALELLHGYVKNPRLRNHCYSSEAVMRGLARRLGRDEDEWGLAGLLHDIDMEVTGGDMKTHALKGAEILQEHGLGKEIIDAVKMHNDEATGRPRSTEFQHALACGETVTGLIHATALVYPGKKIAGVRPESVLKRVRQSAFAAAVRRDHIIECEQIGLSLEEFVTIALDAMKGIAGDIGL